MIWSSAIRPTEENFPGYTFDKHGNRKAHNLTFFPIHTGHQQKEKRDVTTQEWPGSHRSHPYPTLISPVAWETHRKTSFQRPHIFFFRQPQLVPLHVSRLHGSPSYTHGAGADESCSELYKKSQSKYSKRWQNPEKGTPGSPGNPSLSGFQDSSFRCLFSWASKAFSGREWGQGCAGQWLSWPGGEEEGERAVPSDPQQR